MARFPGGFNVFGYNHDTREDYPQDVSRVVTSAPLDEDSFYPDSDAFPGAVRTVQEGQPLDFVTGLVDELEDGLSDALGNGADLPADIRAGLAEPIQPVDVQVARSPGGAKGRVVRFSVKGGTTNAQRLVMANDRRRSISFYNYDGVGTVFWGFSEGEATGGVGGNGFPMPVGSSATLDTQQEIWFSTDDAADVVIRSFTIEDV